MYRIKQLEAEIDYVYSRLNQKEKLIYLLKKGDVNTKKVKGINNISSEMTDLKRKGFIILNVAKNTYRLINKDHEWNKSHRFTKSTMKMD